MAMLNSQAIAAKWRKNLAAAGPDMTAGVNAVTESPMAKAVRQQDALLSNFTEAVTSGKWARNTGRVSLETWRDRYIKVGVPRIVSGAAAGEDKMGEFMGQFIPWLEQGQRKLAAMPRGGLEQNITRAIAMIRHNAEFKRQ